jgi:Uma2 family endonuclease
MPAAVAKLTWDDIKDWPETRVELVEGEAIISPVPNKKHQRICRKLSAPIIPYVESRGLGEFYPHPIHIVLAAGVEYEPDCCFIAAGRDDDPDGATFAGAPDLIIEVISESNRSHDTVVKFRDYERFGVKEYWLVDPRASHVRVFHLDADGNYESLGVFAPGEQIVSRLFPDLAVDPAAIFAKE